MAALFVGSLMLNGRGYVARLPGLVARWLPSNAVERRRMRRTQLDRSST